MLATPIVAAMLTAAVVAAPPERLSETGLDDPAVRRFSPQYPLWSDGAAKRRFVLLPSGTRIDATDPGDWKFPVGTKFWKEFAFEGRKVETRFLWRATDAQWVYATYLWDDAQADAVLAPESGVRGHRDIAPGKRHSIPSRFECTSCHEGGRNRVLGFTALQLSTDRDPMAPHADPLEPGMVTLGTLVEEGRIAPVSASLIAPPRIAARSPRERAVLGYLASNCGTCHNDEGPAAYVGLAFSADSARTLATTLDVAGRYVVPGIEDDATRRIAPAAPDRSAVVYRMSSRRPSSQMPPLGTVLVDQAAVELVRGWIAEELAEPSGQEDPVGR